MTKVRARTVLKIAGNILLYTFLFICVVTLVVTLTAKRESDGTLTVFNRQMRLVLTDSMAACEATDVSDYDVGSIPKNSLVFIETVPEDAEEAQAWYASLREGDVLTVKYVYTTQITITHRITKTPERKAEGGYIIELAGDNKDSDTEQLYQTIDTSEYNSPNYIIGKVTGRSYLLGLILTFLKKPIGLILTVIAPCLIIILLEIFKIIGAYSAERRKRGEALIADKDRELEELRSRLAELESAKDSKRETDTEEREE